MIRPSLTAAALIAVAVAVAGCVTAPEATVVDAPDFNPIGTQSQPRARLFVDGIARATATGVVTLDTGAALLD